jgi:hypothetical protein
MDSATSTIPLDIALMVKIGGRQEIRKFIPSSPYQGISSSEHGEEKDK